MMLIRDGPFRVIAVEALGAAPQNDNVTAICMKKEANDTRCIHELQGALPPVVYNYIYRCKTTQQIWNTLKEKFQGSKQTKKSSLNQCLSEFKQKESESIEAYYD